MKDKEQRNYCSWNTRRLKILRNLLWDSCCCFFFLFKGLAALFWVNLWYNRNYLLTKSEFFLQGKSQARTLPYWSSDRDGSIRQGWGFRFFFKDWTVEVSNKLFIIWLFYFAFASSRSSYGTNVLELVNQSAHFVSYKQTHIMITFMCTYWTSLSHIKL